MRRARFRRTRGAREKNRPSLARIRVSIETRKAQPRDPLPAPRIPCISRSHLAIAFPRRSPNRRNDAREKEPSDGEGTGKERDIRPARRAGGFFRGRPTSSSFLLAADRGAVIFATSSSRLSDADPRDAQPIIRTRRRHLSRSIERRRVSLAEAQTISRERALQIATIARQAAAHAARLARVTRGAKSRAFSFRFSRGTIFAPLIFPRLVCNRNSMPLRRADDAQQSVSTD